MASSDLFLFVSHVTEDREAALEIVHELERRGVPCWITPRDLRPGRPFDDQIADAIEASRAMILIFSERCNENDYIRREVTIAGESQKLIIPFRIENAQPRRGLRVRLADLHWIDGFVYRERAIDEVIRSFNLEEAPQGSKSKELHHENERSQATEEAEAHRVEEAHKVEGALWGPRIFPRYKAPAIISLGIVTGVAVLLLASFLLQIGPLRIFSRPGTQAPTIPTNAIVGEVAPHPLGKVSQILLQEDFEANAQLNTAIWHYPTGTASFIPPANGGPGTQIGPSLPVVANGNLQLTLQTYNPSASPPGTSFRGSMITTTQRFTIDAGPIAFTARARLQGPVPGVLAAISAHNEGVRSLNEVNFQLLSDFASPEGSHQGLTNVYSDSDKSAVGDPQYVPVTDLTKFHYYTMEWSADRVRWFVDGLLMREDTNQIPRGPLVFSLNIWAFNPGARLQPTANPSRNIIYTFEAASVSVARLTN